MAGTGIHEFDMQDREKYYIYEPAINLRYQILEKRCTAIIPDLLIYEIANTLRYNPNFTEMGFEIMENLSERCL
ncbi:MAG: hypothetical protein JW944_04055 [Deltaproteobacteria bacterium]|nr:hypothetical protein [Deltaproteobacteria bacterium]